MRSCKECVYKNHCMEMSRFIPCTSYKKGVRKSEPVRCNQYSEESNSDSSDD
nr:MAG TPA: hypothetical protein [Caudoviricetes sp.]